MWNFDSSGTTDVKISLGGDSRNAGVLRRV